VARDELRRVLEHVDEAVQLAQDVVRDVLRGSRLAVQVNRNVGVAAADLADELAQVQHRRVELGAGRELLVVD
jgi:ribonucleotide reductase alpha subunit